MTESEKNQPAFDDPAQGETHVSEMTSLFEMASTLVAAVDLNEMLDTVLELVRKVLVCDSTFVSLAAAGGRALQIKAALGEGTEGLVGVEFPIDHGINAWIYRNCKPTLIADANQDPRRLHIEGRTESVRAAVGAPLMVDGEAIGTIYAARQHPDSFTESHLSFLTITASHVAAALYQARLLDQARQRAEEMETLYDIGAVMAASRDVDRILQAIYEQSGRIMDTSAFFVALCRPETDEFRFELVYERGERLPPFVLRLSESQGFTAYVIRTAQPLLIHHWEAEREQFAIEPLVLGDPAVSWLGVPIIVQDQVLGVIGSQSFEAYVFTNRQLRLLLAIANQAGISLVGARLYDEMQDVHRNVAQERDKLAHLHQVIADVQRAEELPDKLRLVVDGVCQVGWEWAAISLLDANGRVSELVTADMMSEGMTPADEALLRSGRLPCTSRERPAPGEPAGYQIGECVFVPGDDPGTRGGAWQPHDLLYVPLHGRDGKIIGFLDLAAPIDGRRPGKEGVHVIELFAQETALVIENAHLLDNLRLVNTDLQEMVDSQVHLLQAIEEMIPALNLEQGPEILSRLSGGGHRRV